MSDGEAGRLAPTVPRNASVTSALRGLSIASIPRTCGYDEGTWPGPDMALAASIEASSLLGAGLGNRYFRLYSGYCSCSIFFRL
ncbi:hypothetical protein FVEG_06128 [Fusarium verticillioides 7600]|uniref:Uncharacterized protein n=1 Tax=Gibberella moniliformis (strain M3125 / FGSC 7600) TaxID=334819 RepID=W7M2Q0_GIBM7|nr:hypothetical protein FVEG_06128 [Fusarium verticillioides 7600]EWG45286.1 hypothetical protein FVEG_06128 [Fusarium verticillioides 7600]